MKQTNRTHSYYMNEALVEARKALEAGEVPVGAVIVQHDQIIARAHNRIEERQDATAHAEILALQTAAKFKGDWRLNDCKMYVSLEPCAMCAGAVVKSRLKQLVFGVRDWEQGGTLSNFKIIDFDKNIHKVEVIEGVLEEDCKKILNQFFDKIRNLRENK